MLKLLTLTAVVAAFGGTVGTISAQAEDTRAECPGVIQGITFYRQKTWTWQEKLGVTKFRAAQKHFNSCDYATWVAHRWMKRSAKLHRRYDKIRSTSSRTLASVDSCLHTLIMREGGYNPYATNPTSGAYGAPQALPGSKMASAGPDWRTNLATQIRWMKGYVKRNYGSSCAALSHSYAVGWY